MSRRTFSFVAGLVFALIALGHVLRIIFGWSFTVQGFSVPMWASGLAVIILGYLAYEGFRLARKSVRGVSSGAEFRMKKAAKKMTAGGGQSRYF